MGQRVNIHYSIDIEDLPSTVATLLNSALSQLSATGKEVEGVLEPENALTLATVTQISNLRHELEKIDYALSDVTTLIKSYIQYQTSPPQAETTPTEEAAIPSNPLGGQHQMPPMPTDEELDTLKERLSHFRQNMNSSTEPVANDEVSS